MAREAALFRVQGPRGVYYAIYVEEQQLLFTEANEKGARDHAAEAGLTLLGERSIKHSDLMRLTGRDTVQAKQHVEPAPVRAKPASARDPRPLEARLPRNPVMPDAHVLVRNLGAANPFASSTPLEQTPQAQSETKSDSEESFISKALGRDVISTTHQVKKGNRGSPFSDRSQK